MYHALLHNLKPQEQVQPNPRVFYEIAQTRIRRVLHNPNQKQVSPINLVFASECTSNAVCGLKFNRVSYLDWCLELAIATKLTRNCAKPIGLEPCGWFYYKQTV